MDDGGDLYYTRAQSVEDSIVAYDDFAGRVFEVGQLRDFSARLGEGTETLDLREQAAREGQGASRRLLRDVGGDVDEVALRLGRPADRGTSHAPSRPKTAFATAS